MSTFDRFAALHVPGTPVVLYNAWDAGSATAVAEAGASAIATGSWSVAAAYGFADREQLPLDLALANAARIVAAVDLPVTIDFEGGYAEAPDAVAANVARLADTGAVGCNFEDRVMDGSGLHATSVQAARIAAIRAAVGPAFFVNARTDIFLQAPAPEHDTTKADDAIERCHAYAAAGASGFFVPGLTDLDLIARICAGASLPVNVLVSPGGPDRAALAAAGVARISHGPHPYRAMMAALTEGARAAMA